MTTHQHRRCINNGCQRPQHNCEDFPGLCQLQDEASAPAEPPNAASKATPTAAPIDMVLHCPACSKQHIDAPNTLVKITHHGSGTVVDEQWTNPPHRSHLCHGCGHIWRPADVPTNGVAAVKTKGKADSPISAAPTGEPVEQDPAAPAMWSGLTKKERTQAVDSICEYGTGFVAPLYAVIEGLERVLEQRNAAPAPVERQPLSDEQMAAAVRPLYRDDEAAEMAIPVSMDEYRVIQRACAAAWGVKLAGGAGKGGA